MTVSMSARLRTAVASVVYVALASWLLTAPALAEQKKPSLLQRIRQLIALNRPIAAGGSRSGTPLEVCVITPRTELDAQGRAHAVVALPRPVILAAEPLNEVRIDRNGRRAWRQRASSTQPIEGPVNWPLEPIQPGESLQLLLRPRGAAGSEFAVVTLTGAPAAEMAAHEALVARLGMDASAWLAAIDQALERQQTALAWALLFAPQDPRSEELDGLRREVFSRGCGA
jgi:hypothetical protein